MDQRSLVKWSIRFIALVALVGCWMLLRSLADQLERVSKSKREATARAAGAPDPARVPRPPPPHGRRQREGTRRSQPKADDATQGEATPRQPADDEEPVDERERERTPIPPNAIR